MTDLSGSQGFLDRDLSGLIISGSCPLLQVHSRDKIGTLATDLFGAALTYVNKSFDIAL